MNDILAADLAPPAEEQEGENRRKRKRRANKRERRRGTSSDDDDALQWGDDRAQVRMVTTRGETREQRQRRREMTQMARDGRIIVKGTVVLALS